MRVLIVRESVRYDMRAQWVVRDGDKPGDKPGDMVDLAGELRAAHAQSGTRAHESCAYVITPKSQ